MKYTSNPAPGAAAAPQPAAYTPPPTVNEVPWDLDADVPADPPPAPAPADEPAAAPTEVTVEATPEEHQPPAEPLHQRARAAAAYQTATWLGLYRHPPSLREAWEMSSSLNRARVPDESGLLATLWWLLLYSERLVMFAVILVLLVPAATLLWCAGRPSRRWGLYTVLVLVFVVIPAIAGG